MLRDVGFLKCYELEGPAEEIVDKKRESGFLGHLKECKVNLGKGDWNLLG